MEGLVHLSVSGGNEETIIPMTLDQARALRDGLNTIEPSPAGALLGKALTKEMASRFIPADIKFAHRHGLVRKDVLALTPLGKEVLTYLSAVEIMEEDDAETEVA